MPTLGLTLDLISLAHWCSTVVGHTTSVPPCGSGSREARMQRHRCSSRSVQRACINTLQRLPRGEAADGTAAGGGICMPRTRAAGGSSIGTPIRGQQAATQRNQVRHKPR